MFVTAIDHPVPMLPVAGQPDTAKILPEPADPVEVPEHSYYLRRIASGELKRVEESTTASATGSAKNSAKGTK